ncbi:MAG: acetate/propionate family kinase [Massilia sp.]|nr:acetate/propionate family kinase [Massilia sp.]
MSRGFVCINAGSSSIKFAVYVEQGADLVSTVRGEVDGGGPAPRLLARAPDGARIEDSALPAGAGYDDQLAAVVAWVETHLSPARLAAVGHRVVHGGNAHAGPALVTPALLRELEALAPLAPLHQPHNLAAIGKMAQLHPDLPQVACFDTAFHLGSPRVARLYGLPRALADDGLLRYGFHGLSYQHIAETLPAQEPRGRGRVVAAHLGSGASMCALVDGRSVASSMGFSALDGLPMATRCGSLDPGLLLYLLRTRGMTADALERMLYRDSGLLGLSGISSDMRTLLASPAPAAREAVDVFVYRIARELGSLAAAAGGLDVLVFTGGIGEHAAEIRARVCVQAAWLGVKLDDAANAAGGPRLHAPDSAVAVWAVPADEEAVIARQARAVVDGDAA